MTKTHRRYKERVQNYVERHQNKPAHWTRSDHQKPKHQPPEPHADAPPNTDQRQPS